MPIYRAPVEDYRFLIHEFLEAERHRDLPQFTDLSPDLIDDILTNAGKLCEEVLQPINQSGDEEGCHFENGVVRTPKGFNISRLCDARLDAFFEDAIRTYDPSRIARDIAAIQDRLIDDAPQVALGQVRALSAYTSRLRGVSSNPVTPYSGAWRWQLVPAP